MLDAHYDSPLQFVEKGWSLLDVGCATANLYKFAKARDIQYVGIDITQRLLDAGNERNPDAELHLGSILDIPYPNQSFDVSYAKSVLEHVHPDEAEKAVSELVRVARHMVILVFHRAPKKTIKTTNTQIVKKYYENTFAYHELLGYVEKTGRFKDLNSYSKKRRQFWVIYLK
ncbi:MAG: methyltransferase domain-containing protein [Candidatus Thorarchaeota archaeon]|nr:methyltransferase domain-containing protein [Candidatus Thorarchaeota archaeon]